MNRRITESRLSLDRHSKILGVNLKTDCTIVRRKVVNIELQETRSQIVVKYFILSIIISWLVVLFTHLISMS